jgi:formiminotetrahydrofolate cyclodeaminase
MGETEKLREKSCEDFAAQLASKAPVPGGGGAAAMAGTLAAALCSMVANYTTGKKKYAAYEEDIQKALADADEIRTELLRLIDEDAEAFRPLSKAYSIPKDDPTRADVLEKATLNACRAPMAMMGEISKTVEIIEELEKKGSTMMLSDTGCAAYIAEAALQAAALNVGVNTRTLNDRVRARELDDKADGILREYVPRAHAAAERIRQRIIK